MPESENTEWKVSWRDEYLKWVCAFANTKGGKIFIGKDDNGNIVGLSEFAKLMEDIPNKIQHHIGITSNISLLEENDKKYIEIEIYPYDVAISYHGKYYYRTGSITKELTGSSLNEFLLKKSGRTWDDVIEPRASLDDLDLKAIEAFKKSVSNSKRLPSAKSENDLTHLLNNLRLMEKGKLKNSAVLLFAKDPRRFFPNAFLKIGKFGTSDSDLQSQEVIESNAFQLVDLALDILDKKFLKRIISYEGITRIEKPEYPFEALREILLNAVAHKNYMGAHIQVRVYDDKLIVWNEGSLPEDLKIEDLKKKHDSRPKNPLLADIFFKAGFIESWGRGITKVFEECKKHGLPEPEIELSSGGISVTMLKNNLNEKSFKSLGLNDRQIKTIEYLKEHKRINNSEYQNLNDCSRATASRDLAELAKKELIISSEQKGVGSFYSLK
jgi:ATP-dependent DNA helicase RecG